MRSILLLIILLCLCTPISAQKNDTYRPFSLQVNYLNGLIIPKTDHLNYLIQDKISAIEIRLGFHPNPKINWINQYAVSEVGLAYYTGDLGNDKILGKINSIYPYISFTLLKWGNLKFNTDVGLGLAILSKYYHPVDNYANSLLGSKYNANVNLSTSIKYSLADIDFIGGLYFSHISNGSSQHPNDGYNFINSKIGISYNFGKKKEYVKLNVSYPKQPNEFSIVSNHAFREKSTNDPHKYYISTLSITHVWGLNSKQRFGLGIDLFYDESINRGDWNLNPETSFDHRFYQGVFIAHDLVFNKFTFITQLGVYTYYKSSPSSQSIYNRLGLRYRFSKHLLVNIGLKAYFDKSDYIEFGIGYYISKKKNHARI